MSPLKAQNFFQGIVEGEIRGIQTAGKTQLSAGALKLEGPCEKEYGWHLWAEQAPVWQPARKWDQKTVAARNWILPIPLVSLEVDSTPRPPYKSLVTLATWLEPCKLCWAHSDVSPTELWANKWVSSEAADFVVIHFCSNKKTNNTKSLKNFIFLISPWPLYVLQAIISMLLNLLGIRPVSLRHDKDQRIHYFILETIRELSRCARLWARQRLHKYVHDSHYHNLIADRKVKT